MKKQDNGQSHGTAHVEEQETNSGNNKESFKPVIIPIDNTPFAIVKLDENRHKVIFGKHAITNREFYSATEAKQFVSLLDWNTLLNVIGVYVEHALEQFKSEYLTKN